MQGTRIPPVALTIAGSDNSCGAGAQADLKTFTALGVYGLTAITCVVAEIPGRVSAIQPVSSNNVADQVRLCFEAYPIAAVKTGLLYSREVVDCVCELLGQYLRGGTPPALVVDPVMVATGGDPLLKPEAIAAYQERLFGMAALVTPNMDEVRTLLGREVETAEQMREAAAELTRRYNTAFLVKGGHLRDSPAIDILCREGRISELSAPRVEAISTHGTGCTYAAAITAGLARGLELLDAVTQAKEYVTRAIRHHFSWTRAGEAVTAALNHNPPDA